MTQIELQFYTVVPRLLRQLIDELKTLNDNLKTKDNE